MANYALSNKAVEDLTKIWAYTFEVWSENQADKYYTYLIDCCEAIAAKPSIGKSYSEITDDLFGYRANRHIIFYRQSSSKRIEIIRILQGQMDLKSKLTD